MWAIIYIMLAVSNWWDRTQQEMDDSYLRVSDIEKSNIIRIKPLPTRNYKRQNSQRKPQYRTQLVIDA